MSKKDEVTKKAAEVKTQEFPFLTQLCEGLLKKQGKDMENLVMSTMLQATATGELEAIYQKLKDAITAFFGKEKAEEIVDALGDMIIAKIKRSENIYSVHH